MISAMPSLNGSIRLTHQQIPHISVRLFYKSKPISRRELGQIRKDHTRKMTKIVAALSLLCACLTAQGNSSTRAFTDETNQNTPNSEDRALNPVVQWNRTLLV